MSVQVDPISFRVRAKLRCWNVAAKLRSERARGSTTRRYTVLTLGPHERSSLCTLNSSYLGTCANLLANPKGLLL